MVILSSRDNINVKNAVKLSSAAKFRRKNGEFIAEGVRVCMDALKSQAEISAFFTTQSAAEKYGEEFAQLSKYADKTFMVTDEVFSVMSDTETPQGFLCIIKALDKIREFDTINKNGRYIALDNVQDPSNLGTILRSAEAFGIDGVILSDDCCDIYSPKVVRGSMGAVFRIPFIRCGVLAEFLAEHSEINTYAAVVSGGAEKLGEVDFELPCTAVIGNEGNGLKAETVAVCKNSVTIPMNGKAESLNAAVAASIIIWEMMK